MSSSAWQRWQEGRTKQKERDKKERILFKKSKCYQRAFDKKVKPIWEQEFQDDGGYIRWSGLGDRIFKMLYTLILLPFPLMFIFCDAGLLLFVLSTISLPFFFLSLLFDFIRLFFPEPDLIINDEGIQARCTLHALDTIDWSELRDAKCRYKDSPSRWSFSDSLQISLSPDSFSAPRRRPKPWRYLHWVSRGSAFGTTFPSWAHTVGTFLVCNSPWNTTMPAGKKGRRQSGWQILHLKRAPELTPFCPLISTSKSPEA